MEPSILRTPRGGRFETIGLIKLLSIVTPILLAVSGTAGHSQPCNPAIDGTYCASVPIRKPAGVAPQTTNRTLGGALSSDSYDQPATLGAITFSGDSRCIGLLRRVSCK